MSSFTYPSGDESTDTVTNLLGWGVYVDSLATATQTITTTPTELSIDALGAGTNEVYLPNSISGGSSLWDGTSNVITPAAVGDSYDLRVDFLVTAKSGGVNFINMELDIGGGASPSNVIVERTINTSKSTPFGVDAGFPIFALATFLANGGRIFLSTDTGSVTLANRSVFISRNYSATA